MPTGSTRHSGTDSVADSSSRRGTAGDGFLAGSPGAMGRDDRSVAEPQQLTVTLLGDDRRRAYLHYIDATKRRPEERAARIAEVVALLADGIKQRPNP